VLTPSAVVVGAGDGGAESAPAGDATSIAVGFVTGHGEPSIDGQLSGVAEVLGRTFEVREVGLAGGADALRDIDVLVVAGGPDVPDSELYELDQFIMRGGRVAFLLDAAAIPENGTQANLSEGNIFGYLSVYGITVNPDLVLDRTCADAARWGDVSSSNSYPFWPVVRVPGISTSHPAMSGVVSVSMAWTSSITTRPGAAGDVSTSVLLRSSPDSWTLSAYTDLAPRSRYDPPSVQDDVNRVASGVGFPLAVAAEGEFRSAFAGKQVIMQSGRKVEFVDPEGKIEDGAPTKLVVFGGSMMFRDDVADQLHGNAEILAGVVNWLASGESGARVEPPVVAQDRTPRTLAFGLIAAVLLAALAAAGLAVLRRKR
jgi:ABC-type uncharacterized transport system involved in gliding motility auxiliary subunit